MKLKDKQAIDFWDQYKKQVDRSTPIDINETLIEQKKRIEWLEKYPEHWFKYYFPSFCTADPAPFHIKATKRWLENERWYEVRAWSRELSKSGRAMLEDMYLMLTRKSKLKILISYTFDNACRLLKPYQINLETNHRIINDYGEQKSIGQWEAGDFTTKMGFSFIAIGVGQSPRGTRKEEQRPDILDFDDIDTDEDCRNPKIVKQNWSWIEKAAIPTMSISGRRRIRFNGNIIAKYCCISEAIKKARYHEIINIRNKNGLSSWPQKNSEQDINEVLSEIGYIAQQQEYFNNPITEGTIFQEIHYKHLPKICDYKFMVCYVDLSYKSSTKNDYKAAVLMGKWKEEYHVHKCWLKQGTTRELAAGLIDIKNYVRDKTALYFYAEENFIQDIILKELHGDIANLNETISLTPDTRKKPDKFHRIESTLEPLNTNGKLFFNEAEKSNPFMQVMEEQFKALEPGTRTHDDGPDACEGAKHIVDSKNYTDGGMLLGTRRPHSKRF